MRADCGLHRRPGVFVPPVHMQRLRLPKRNSVTPATGVQAWEARTRSRPSCGLGQRAWVRVSTPAFPGEGSWPPSASRRPQAAPTPTRRELCSATQDGSASMAEKAVPRPGPCRLPCRPRSKAWGPGHCQERACERHGRDRDGERQRPPASGQVWACGLTTLPGPPSPRPPTTRHKGAPGTAVCPSNSWFAPSGGLLRTP